MLLIANATGQWCLTSWKHVEGFICVSGKVIECFGIGEESRKEEKRLKEDIVSYDKV